MSVARPNILVAVALGAVVLVLLLGLVNMMRGGSSNMSQKLMRWRVGLQFVAIVVIMGVLWFRGGCIEPEDAWSSSTASTRAPATTARRRSAPASAGRNTICASRPTARSTRPMRRIGIARLVDRGDLRRTRRDAGAHPERPLRPRRRSLHARHAARSSTTSRLRIVAGAGRSARERDRRAERRARAAALLRAARRLAGGGGAASGPHGLPPGRAADGRARRRRRARRSATPALRYINRLSDFLFVASRARQCATAPATCSGCPARTADAFRDGEAVSVAATHDRCSSRSTTALRCLPASCPSAN